MNLEDIKNKIEEQFVEEYENLNQFLIQINDTLNKFNIITKYNNYDEFCLDIEYHVLNYFKKNTIDDLTPEIMTKVLNNMIKYKILDDPDFEGKLKIYFEDFEDSDDIMKDIENMKINLKKK